MTPIHCTDSQARDQFLRPIEPWQKVSSDDGFRTKQYILGPYVHEPSSFHRTDERNIVAKKEQRHVVLFADTSDEFIFHAVDPHQHHSVTGIARVNTLAIAVCGLIDSAPTGS
jgi:hypothetical protein